MAYQYRNNAGSNVLAVTVDTPYPESDEMYDLCVCHYTGMIIVRQDAVVLGPVVPQCTLSFLCHPLAGPVRNKSIKIFQSFEKNCNTCKHLERVKFDKKSFSISGLMPGKCKKEKSTPLYPQGGNDILFAPDDCMLQECYEGR